MTEGGKRFKLCDHVWLVTDGERIYEVAIVSKISGEYVLGRLEKR